MRPNPNYGARPKVCCAHADCSVSCVEIPLRSFLASLLVTLLASFPMLMPAQTNFLSRLAFVAFAFILTKPDQAPDSDIAEAVRQRRGLPLRHPERAAERQKQREMEEQQWQQPQQQQLGNNGAPARNMREAQLRQQQQWAQQHVQEQQQLQQQREADAQLGGGGESYDELRKRNRMTPGYQVAPAPSPPQQVWIRN